MSAAPRTAALVAAELAKANEAHRLREQDRHQLSDAPERRADRRAKAG